MPRQGYSLFLAVLLISLLLHFLWMTNLSDYVANHPFDKVKKPVKVKITYKPAPPNQEAKKTDRNEPQDRMVETKMEETKEKPINPKFSGAQDHKTDKETKIRKKDTDDALLNAGQQGDKNEAVAKRQGQKKPVAKKSQEKLADKQYDPTSHLTKPKSQIDSVTVPEGKVSIGPIQRQPRNVYESMMPTQEEMADTRTRGYLDNLSDDIASGDKIDLNTTNYRYIGYMSGFRKQFYMVWTYPGEAVRRGLEGVVVCEFTIQKDGTVKNIIVRRTSGYKILDQAVVEALRLGSPYTPLPEGFPKKPLTIVGSFSYALSSYAGN